MFMVETPLFNRTTQQAGIPPCRMEETRREASRLRKKQAQQRLDETLLRTT